MKNGKKTCSPVHQSIRLICGIVIMAVIICGLTVFILSIAGVITIGETSPATLVNKNGDIYIPEKSPDNNETSLDESELPIENSGDFPAETSSKGIIVIDPGHGKSSSAMTEAEKTRDGWIYNPQKGGWGEWRHFKSNTIWQDCLGSGCTGRAPKNGGCWYSIGSGDRDTEPELNMNNALAAKKYLEDMGYTVRLTRTTNENPSMTKRLEYCYPNNDTTQSPDADLFICLHSNAGGGSGSYYIALSGLYDQAGIPNNYIESGNTLGKCINDRIVSGTSLAASSGGRYDGYPELVLFCKSPITIAYLEIGFYDNGSDLAILKSESDSIGKAIANGINDYMNM